MLYEMGGDKIKKCIKRESETRVNIYKNGKSNCTITSKIIQNAKNFSLKFVEYIYIMNQPTSIFFSTSCYLM